MTYQKFAMPIKRSKKIYIQEQKDERISNIAIDGEKRDEHAINIGAKEIEINGNSGFDHATSLGDKKDEQKLLQTFTVDGCTANIEVKEEVRISILASIAT
ncbi:hypothetical protein DSO57_1012420 [Entomophthora muscae]|uniref:Uncharacterized protein n=1 Tax=Entomophthora muscae TaxID=34485 RepID=A0ACC2URW0_9FUNG|nr:hypothetical protein DSO57_1012420 [Entomophthora muscae]